ncbi:MAG: H-NS histone family protein [Shimia sp.]
MPDFAQMNLADLTDEELTLWAKALPKEKARRHEEARRAAIQALEEVSAGYGYTLAELLGADPAKVTPAPVRYRDPDTALNTWSGHGRRPRLFLDAQARGVTREDMEVAR